MLEDKGLLVAEAGGRVNALATSMTDPLIELLATRTEVVDDYLELRATLERMAAALAASRGNEWTGRRSAPAWTGSTAPTPRRIRTTRPTPMWTCTWRSTRRATTSCCCR